MNDINDSQLLEQARRESLNKIIQKIKNDHDDSFQYEFSAGLYNIISEDLDSIFNNNEFSSLIDQNRDITEIEEAFHPSGKYPNEYLNTEELDLNLVDWLTFYKKNNNGLNIRSKFTEANIDWINIDFSNSKSFTQDFFFHLEQIIFFLLIHYNKQVIIDIQEKKELIKDEIQNNLKKIKALEEVMKDFSPGNQLFGYSLFYENFYKNTTNNQEEMIRIYKRRNKYLNKSFIKVNKNPYNFPAREIVKFCIKYFENLGFEQINKLNKLTLNIINYLYNPTQQIEIFDSNFIKSVKRTIN